MAMIAPPWIPVPPDGYGGIEAVVSLLCEELVARGHDVTLFAAPGSRSAATLCSPLGSAHPDRIGASVYEADHVGVAYDAVVRAAAEAHPFDVVHDHSGFTGVAMAPRSASPVVHTLHAPFDEQTTPFYLRHGHKVRLVAISRFQQEHAPVGVRVAEMVPNPISVEDWPFRADKDEYLLWVGRFDPVKGAHRAIRVARRAGMPLVLAGPVQPGQEEHFRRAVKPHIDGSAVRYVEEVGGAALKELVGYPFRSGHGSCARMPSESLEPRGEPWGPTRAPNRSTTAQEALAPRRSSQRAAFLANDETGT